MHPDSDALSSLLAALPDSRLAQQIAFIVEIDRLKSVLRQTYLASGDRRENSAEHSWHLALLALTLAEHAAEPVDVAQVVRMALVHDLVEIDAGDTFVYDAAGMESKVERERLAAERLFGLLPDDQRDAIRAIWDEFEAGETPEAKFAAALDRTMPMLHNFLGQGGTWRAHGVTADRVRKRNFPALAAGAPALYGFGEAMIADAVRRGYLMEPGDASDSAAAASGS